MLAVCVCVPRQNDATQNNIAVSYNTDWLTLLAEDFVKEFTVIAVG